MKIIRYSPYGFTPQYQSHHLEMVNYHFNQFDISLFPFHLQNIIKIQHEQAIKFYKENYDDFKYGIWAFIDGFKNNQALNHLKNKVPCWKAEISDDTTVYDVNWTKKIKVTDGECRLFGFYIPKKELIDLKEVN